MDIRLRVLKRKAESDPQLWPLYARALERVIGGQDAEPVFVWLVLFCTENTTSEDVHLFDSEAKAGQYMAERMIQDIRTAHTEGAIETHTMLSAVADFEGGFYDQLQQIYEYIVGPTMWYEIAQKEIE